MSSSCSLVLYHQIMFCGLIYITCQPRLLWCCLCMWLQTVGFGHFFSRLSAQGPLKLGYKALISWKNQICYMRISGHSYGHDLYGILQTCCYLFTNLDLIKILIWFIFKMSNLRYFYGCLPKLLLLICHKTGLRQKRSQ